MLHVIVTAPSGPGLRMSARTQPGGLELLAVVLAVGDAELSGCRKLLQLLASELGEALQVVVQAREVVAGRNVVVDDRFPRRRCEDLGHGVGTDRVMDEEKPVATRDEREVVPRACERAHLRLRFRSEQVTPYAARPEDPLQLEAIVADGIATRDTPVQLV